MGVQTLLPMQPATTTRSMTMTAHSPIRVFLLSDHQLLRGGVARALRNQADISLVGAQQSSLTIAAEIMKSTCDVLLVDPVNTSALESQVLDQLQNELSSLRIVFIEMEAKVADVISAVLSGSRPYQDLGHAQSPG